MKGDDWSWNGHVKNKHEFNVVLCGGAEMNRWLSQRHYLHRPMIRSKLLGYSITIGNKRVGGILWATPHFTKKNGLFGFEGLPDKWEVLMLARFYLEPDAGLIVSSALMRSVGKKGSRIQNDWVNMHPPKFPENPYVPRLLISWSDSALAAVDCDICGNQHNGNHEGTIYKASNWEFFDTTKSNGRRTSAQSKDGEKILWVKRLPRNIGAEKYDDVRPYQVELV